MSAEYIPKVGDRVIITKSNENWCESMDRYDGVELTISSIGRYGDFAQFEKAKGTVGINMWTWNFRQGHFKLINKKEPEFIFGI